MKTIFRASAAPAFKSHPFLSLVMAGMAAALLSSCATRHSAKESFNQSEERQLPGWGRISDAEEDCKFFVAGDTLLIHVPGSAFAHDLAPEIGRTDAPRVLRRVNGDFTIQVRVDGRFSPGEESTQDNRVAYNGAGLVVMADPQNVITLARAVLQNSGEGSSSYANFEIRTNGHLKRIGMTGDHPLPPHGPVFLRLRRLGSEMIGSVSLDGVHWKTLGTEEIPNKWPATLHTGVVAISTSKEEFNPQFSKLRIVK